MIQKTMVNLKQKVKQAEAEYNDFFRKYFPDPFKSRDFTDGRSLDEFLSASVQNDFSRNDVTFKHQF